VSVETVDGSLKERTIDIGSNHAVVEVMRCTVYVRTERTRQNTSAKHTHTHTHKKAEVMCKIVRTRYSLCFIVEDKNISL
jgi:hypothetical protein